MRCASRPTWCSRRRSYPEKQGEVTHPDGRVQHVRRGVRHVGETRDELYVLEELMNLIGAAVLS